MATLPMDVLLLIACYLDTEDLINACAVSKEWLGTFTLTPQVWQHPKFHIAFSFDRKHNIYKPSPSAVISHLKAEPIKSLHISGPMQYVNHYRQAGGSLFYNTRRLSDRISCSSYDLEGLFRFVNSLAIQDDPSEFHLVVDGFEVYDLKLHVIHATSRLSATRLSVGAFPVYDDFASMAEHLFMLRPSAPRPWLCGIRNADLFCSFQGLSVFPTLPHASHSHYVVGHPQSAPPEHLATFSCIVPEYLYHGWHFLWNLRELRLHPFVRCHIVGGAWKIPQEVNYNTQHLIWRNIWKVQSRGTTPVFLGLRTLDLSFHESKHVSWDDIARLLTSTFHEGLEVLRLRFPKNDDGGQLDMINKVWRDCIIMNRTLQELELDNYMPPTLTVLCDDGKRNLRKLVLSNDILPRDFTTLFIPDTLPQLQHFDLSKAYWRPATRLIEQKEWRQRWMKAGISIFKPPKRYSDSQMQLETSDCVVE